MKPKLQTCFKGGKISRRASKNPPNHSSVYSDDNFRWSIKTQKNDFDLYIQGFEFTEDSAIFKPCVNTQKHKLSKVTTSYGGINKYIIIYKIDFNFLTLCSEQKLLIKASYQNSSVFRTKTKFSAKHYS